MKHKRTETDLVKACLTVLHATEIFAWRVNTGAARIGTRFVRFGRPGVADILGVLPGGRFLAVECKTGRNLPTAEQEAFLGAVRRAGGLAWVVYEVDDLLLRLEWVCQGSQGWPTFQNNLR